MSSFGYMLGKSDLNKRRQLFNNDSWFPDSRTPEEKEKKYAAKEIQDNHNRVNIHLTLEEKMKNNPGPFIGLNFVQVCHRSAHTFLF